MRSRTNLTITVGLLLLGTASIANFLQFYSAFIPRHFDQTVPLLQFYDAYYSWKDGASPIHDFFRALLTLQTLKGGLTQSVGFLVSILIGPNRLSLWLPNLAALVLFLAVVYHYASRSMSKEAALIIAALPLLGPAIYMSAGGFFDLRWDFVGIMAFGCFLLFFAKLINQNTRTNIVVVITLSLIAIDARSINMVFVGLTIFGVTLIFFLLSTWKSLRSYAWTQIKSMLILGTIVFMFCVVFAIIHWTEIDSYYLAHLRTGEELIREKEFGAEAGLLVYYIQSTLRLHKTYFGYSLLVLAALWTYWWIFSGRFSRPDSTSTTTTFVESKFRWRIEGAVIAIVATIAVLGSVSLFSPSPIMPAYLLGTCSLLVVCAAPSIKQNGGNAFQWFCLIILFSFAVLRIGSMQSWSKSELKSHSNALQLFQSVLAEFPEGGRIYFSVIDEAILPQAFMIWLYENGNRQMKDKFAETWLGVLPLSSTEHDARLSDSDVVFRWVKDPVWVTFPSEEQLKGEFGKTSWARYSSQFVRLKDVPYKSGILGTYVRRVRVTEIFVPYKMEAGSWFWLGDEHARISIVNKAGNVLPTKVSATLGLGPSVPKGSQVKLCVMSGNSVLNCYPVNSNKNGFEIVILVAPGENEVELSVVHDDDMILSPVPNDTRHLLLNVSNLRISEVGQ